MESKDFIWEEIHSQRNWGRYPNEELVRFIGRNFFKLPKEKRKKIKILELGIGQGANAWFLIREGFDVYGIDLSGSAIKKFVQRLNEEKLIVKDFNQHFKLADIRNIPFKNEYFDVIIDVATVWCVPYSDHEVVFQEVFRMLNHNGLFFSWHILKDSWGDDGKNYIDKDTKNNIEEGPLANEGITCFMRMEDLIKILEENGLKILNKETLQRSYEDMKQVLNYAIIYAKKT